MKIMFLITQDFPYGQEFLDEEIKYLSNGFYRINIITRNCTSREIKQVPGNVSVLRYDNSYEKSIFNILCFFLSFFNDAEMRKDFFCELRRLRGVYKLPLFPKIKLLLATLFRARIFSSYLLNIIDSERVDDGDQIYLYAYWCTLDAYAIAKCKDSIKNYKAITRCHGYDLYFERNDNFYLPFKKMIADKLDKIFFISDQGRNYFIKTHDIKNSNNLCVSRLGTKRVNKLTENSKDGVFRIVSCSRVISIKRIELIIEALSMIDDAIVLWTHIGTGPLFNEIKKYAEEKLMPKNNIKFMFMGAMNNRQVYDFYTKESIDLFVNVSSSEGIPVSIMEACSFGIPIIATNVGGTSELVSLANGVLLSGDVEPKEIANSIMRILSLDKKSMDKLKQGAFNVWKNKYNSDDNYKNFARELMSL